MRIIPKFSGFDIILRLIIPNNAEIYNYFSEPYEKTTKPNLSRKKNLRAGPRISGKYFLWKIL